MRPYLRCRVDGQGFRALVKGNHLGESLQPVPRSVVGPGLYAEAKKCYTILLWGLYT